MVKRLFAGNLRHKLAARLQGVPRSPAELDRSLYLLRAFRKLGWFASVRSRKPIDEAGGPIPWWTYSAIFWLEPSLHRGLRVLEFGSGHSSLWLAERVGSVLSIEHDAGWAERLRATAPPRLEVLLRTSLGDDCTSADGDPYLAAPRGRGPFDLVVVDGLARCDCLAQAPEHLADDGLVLLDDSDRPDYFEGVEALQNLGFDRLDFYGFKADGTHFGCTSVFARSFGRWASTPRPPARPIGGPRVVPRPER